MSVTEVKQSPIDSVKTNYLFILTDYNEGINYNIDKDRYNDDMEILGSDEKVEASVNQFKYLSDVYELLKGFGI